VVSVGLLVSVHRLISYRAAVASIQNHTGYRVFINPASILSSIIPRIKGFTLGGNFAFDQKYEPFKQAGWDVVSVVSVWPAVVTTMFVADAALIKEITSSRHHWPKPAYIYRSLTFFGKNIVASEGEDWKRYRKVTAPAFSDRNNRLVWDETCRIMQDLFDNIWGNKDEIMLHHCVDVTLQACSSLNSDYIHLIFPLGFGRRVPLIDDLTIPEGHRLTFKDALHIVSTGTPAKIIFPKWMMSLTAGLVKVQLGFDELHAYMLEMVQAGLADRVKEERHDLFGNLLAANDEDVEVNLSISEVVGEMFTPFPPSSQNLTYTDSTGNAFIYQLAGHETTAHTLAFAFAMLALYPDEQEKLYEHVKNVLPVDRPPVLRLFPSISDLHLSLSISSLAFYEMPHPTCQIPAIPKICTWDTVITTTNGVGERKAIPVQKGTYIVLDAPAVHYNPRYWENPHDFKPERFLKDWPRDGFMAFSAGARGCVGRKFAETEGIAILTLMVSRYRIELADEPELRHETIEQARMRLTTARFKLGVLTLVSYTYCERC
ncbi:hypothetical protein PILCRDRAFT_790075, partial [Piloderma croceum F 1598]